jgi:hypothetical protein
MPGLGRGRERGHDEPVLFVDNAKVALEELPEPADRVAHTKALLDQFAELTVIHVRVLQYLGAQRLNLMRCKPRAPMLLVLEGGDALLLDAPDPREDARVAGSCRQCGGVRIHAFGNKGKRQHLPSAWRPSLFRGQRAEGDGVCIEQVRARLGSRCSLPSGESRFDANVRDEAEPLLHRLWHYKGAGGGGFNRMSRKHHVDGGQPGPKLMRQWPLQRRRDHTPRVVQVGW